MARPLQCEKVKCRYYAWILRLVGDVYHADGRPNRPSTGRYSLGTRDYSEARKLLEQLDLKVAVRNQLAKPPVPSSVPNPELSLTEGRALYMKRASRSKLVGGIRPSSQKRYKAVFDNFLKYAATQGLSTWRQVTAKTLEEYAAHSERLKRAPRTIYLELTTIKQAVTWLVREKLLPADCLIHLPLEKPQGTDTYCWRPEEVRAILDCCRKNPDLHWLGDILEVLTFSGMRIGEALGLRWSNVLFSKRVLNLVDETFSRSRNRQTTVQTTKGARAGASRSTRKSARCWNGSHGTRTGMFFTGRKGDG